MFCRYFPDVRVDVSDKPHMYAYGGYCSLLFCTNRLEFVDLSDCLVVDTCDGSYAVFSDINAAYAALRLDVTPVSDARFLFSQCYAYVHGGMLVVHGLGNSFCVHEKPFEVLENPVLWSSLEVNSALLKTVNTRWSDVGKCHAFSSAFLVNSVNRRLVCDMYNFGRFFSNKDMAGFLSYMCNRLQDNGFFGLYTELKDRLSYTRLLFLLDNGYAVQVPFSEGVLVPSFEKALDNPHSVVFLKLDDGKYFYVDQTGAYCTNVDEIASMFYANTGDLPDWYPGFLVYGVRKEVWMLSDDFIAKSICDAEHETVIDVFSDKIVSGKDAKRYSHLEGYPEAVFVGKGSDLYPAALSFASSWKQFVSRDDVSVRVVPGLFDCKLDTVEYDGALDASFSTSRDISLIETSSSNSVLDTSREFGA